MSGFVTPDKIYNNKKYEERNRKGEVIFDRRKFQTIRLMG
jgi:hypothetical protein